MSRSGKGHKDRKRRINKTDFLDPSAVCDGDISSEKQKARKLRNSSWWKRKIAGGKCHYCSKELRPEDLTMDHLIPLARGGKSEKFNLVPACKECNNNKKYLLPAEWDEHLEMIKNKDN